MSVHQSKSKSFSYLSERELLESLAADLEAMTEAEREMFIMALDTEDYSMHAMAMAELELEREIVPISDWLEDPYHMGEIGKTLYKPWKEDLIEMYESQQYDQALIVGGIGSGKSTFSQIAVIRMLYEASCLRDPVQSYGLAKGSKIGFCNLATSKETARRVVFEGILAKLNESPYFKHEFPMIKDVKEEIIFNKGLVLVAGSSTDTSVIGMNIFGGIIDEGNFLTRKPSKRHMDTDRSKAQNYTQAHRLYESIVRRMKSRYMKKGKLPGVLIVSSSKTTQDSFTEQIIREAKTQGNNRIFVSDRSIIDVKREHFGDKVFHVLAGNDKYRSKILEPNEVAAYSEDEEAVVVEVPEDLRIDFESDIDGALRDLAGVSTIAISSFLQKVELVEKIFDDNLKHPFISPLAADPSEWDSISPYRINWQQICKQTDTGEWVPLRNPEQPRVVHLDPAKSGDAFGLCISHISGFKEVPRPDGASDWVVEKQPVFEVDFYLRIKAQPGEEIVFRNVRQILYEFSAHGFHLYKITTDTFQSVEMIQTLQAKGYRAEILSVDTSKEPYLVLRNAIYEGRLKAYRYSIVGEELKKLEDTPQKIDHPTGGSKDMADALCGSIFSLASEFTDLEGLLPVKGESLAPPSGVVDENFAARQVDSTASGTVVVTEGDRVTKVYHKKPKTLAPSYNKVKTDGTVERLGGGSGKSLSDDDPFFVDHG